MLSSLSSAASGSLRSQLVHVRLPAGARLVEPNTPVSMLYFLERGMASITSADQKGNTVEVGFVGREGVVGAEAVVGQCCAVDTVMMQFAGEGFRLPANVLEEPSREALVWAIQRFLLALLGQATRLVLCNRFHPLEARLARWLLTAADTTESDSLACTQDFVAQMLGTSRPSVTLAAGALQRKGLIRYTRGSVEVLRRHELCLASCECYRAIRENYALLFPELGRDAAPQRVC